MKKQMSDELFRQRAVEEGSQSITAGSPDKGPIAQPRSACSAGDTAMEHHDHDYVAKENRVRPSRCVHCDPSFKPGFGRGEDWPDWCYCECHYAGEEF